ncbi:MAG TPA: IS66 family transposase [Solirubrobacterales bacterium]
MIPPPDDVLPDDPATLKAIILAQRAEALRMAASVRAYEALIQALRIRIAKLKRQKFGSSSEKIEREIDQLRLALEDLEVAMATAEATAASAEPTARADARCERALPRRRGKPRIDATTVRERVVLDPGERCPDCGGALRLVGEDVAEMLELVASQLKVIETARLKKSCRQCERMVQPAAPMRPIPRGMAGPGLLAHILVAKYDDHLPLYRQGEILARQGADIPRSTLIDWCGQAVAVLRPLVERIRADVMRSDRLHADDTPVRVLDATVRQTRGKAKAVKEGRLWVYVRDDRPWGGTDPPAAAYSFSPDRKGEHPQGHLARFTGILQADAYGGFAKLYEATAPDATPRVREAACWAHLRRDFHDVWKATGSPVAQDALERIGRLYDIEREITGQSAERRRDVRRTRSRPHVDGFRTWCERQLAGIPAKGDLARAMRYALKRWDAFTLFLEDGRVAIDNNPAERAIRPVALGRRNWLFAGSDAGGETLADAMTIIETTKLSGLDPEAYLADVLARINDHLVTRLDELLPWNWARSLPEAARAA